MHKYELFIFKLVKNHMAKYGKWKCKYAHKRVLMHDLLKDILWRVSRWFSLFLQIDFFGLQMWVRVLLLRLLGITNRVRLNAIAYQ